ncbi:MAG: hypothetical protein B6I25_07575, partial [Planctomycetales bacterium 4572_13]
MRMKKLPIIILICLFSASWVQAEPLHITFDPASRPGGSIGIDSWTENGIFFTGPNGFGHSDSGKEARPDNGTAYLSFAIGPPQTLMIQSIDSTPFQLFSVDLAEYSILFDRPKDITFIGHKNDGTTVTQDFTL